MAESYKTWVRKTGKRKGWLTCGNGPEMEFGAPPDAHGKEGWLTPEDAFAGALNTCIHLDKTEVFTHVVLRPRITVRNDDGSKVHRALQMARKYSLIAPSLKSDLIIEPEIIIEATV